MDIENVLLNDLGQKELKSICAKLGLSVSGAKSDLKHHIVTYLNERMVTSTSERQQNIHPIDQPKDQQHIIPPAIEPPYENLFVRIKGFLRKLWNPTTCAISMSFKNRNLSAIPSPPSVNNAFGLIIEGIKSVMFVVICIAAFIHLYEQLDDEKVSIMIPARFLSRK